MLVKARTIDLDALARVGGVLPSALIRAALRRLLEHRSLALCLHRVTLVPAQASALCVEASVLEGLIELLLSARPRAGAGWLTVTFDDGYADAAHWLATRAWRFPEVEFLVFLCPEKIERRAGFRWDLEASSARRADAVAFDVDTENTRPELLGLGDAFAYRLASLSALRELALLPNVTLGNHTNLHAIATTLPLETVAEDYLRSTRAFERLFGQQRHFAFPFGTPGKQFDGRHVELLRALGEAIIWSTEARPSFTWERKPRAVLPRCPIIGGQSVTAVAAWLAARALNHHLQRWNVLGH